MRGLQMIGCISVAAVIWAQVLRWGFASDAAALAAPLARGQLAVWRDERRLEASLLAMRASNPEWDLMSRMFAVLAFGELAAQRPAERAQYVEAIDRIVERTVAELGESTGRRFLLPYAAARPFVDGARRSIFVDGEVAMMLAVRATLSASAQHLAAARPWIDRIAAQLARAPHGVAESYPDEAWIFCNTVALAAIRLYDTADGAPARHQALLRGWVAGAKARLVDARTGLLVAKTSYAAEALEGPEGSSLWLAATMLLLVDEEFARAQYARARAELRGALAGFGWAREWPRGQVGADDLDSGPTIPMVGANAGSSGLALVAARAFGDAQFERELAASLGLAAFPVDGGARFAAGNQLSDAVILWAAVFGPTWTRVRGGRA